VTWGLAKYVASLVRSALARPARVRSAKSTGEHGPAPNTAPKSKPPATCISPAMLWRRGLTLHVKTHLSLSRGASFETRSQS
jgi:hypothetical protein